MGGVVRVNSRSIAIAVATAAAAGTFNARAISQTTPTRPPSVASVFTTERLEVSPKEPATSVRVSETGRTLFEAEAGQDLRMLVLDSMGRVVTRFGRVGGGPGEVRIPVAIGIASQGPVVWDAGQNRLTEWSFAGRLLRTTTAQRAFAASAWTPRGLLGLMTDSGVALPALLGRGGEFHVSVPRTAPLFKDLFIPAPNAAVPYSSTVGYWAGGITMVNPGTYRGAVYTWAAQPQWEFGGDPSPVRVTKARATAAFEKIRRLMAGRLTETQLTEMKTRAEDATYPPISPASPPSFDDRGRLWVLGLAGDSAYAEVHTPAGPLVRLGLPCLGFEGRWNVAGRWLAMICQSEDEEFEGDAVVRLFRIVN